MEGPKRGAAEDIEDAPAQKKPRYDPRASHGTPPPGPSHAPMAPPNVTSFIPTQSEILKAAPKPKLRNKRRADDDVDIQRCIDDFEKSVRVQPGRSIPILPVPPARFRTQRLGKGLPKPPDQKRPAPPMPAIRILHDRERYAGEVPAMATPPERPANPVPNLLFHPHRVRDMHSVQSRPIQADAVRAVPPKPIPPEQAFPSSVLKMPPQYSQRDPYKSMMFRAHMDELKRHDKSEMMQALGPTILPKRPQGASQEYVGRPYSTGCMHAPPSVLKKNKPDNGYDKIVQKAAEEFLQKSEPIPPNSKELLVAMSASGRLTSLMAQSHRIGQHFNVDEQITRISRQLKKTQGKYSIVDVYRILETMPEYRAMKEASKAQLKVTAARPIYECKMDYVAYRNSLPLGLRPNLTEVRDAFRQAYQKDGDANKHLNPPVVYPNQPNVVSQ
ncbi:hypothetical protein QR680_003148 [Steinernema hermaphroditum]|uniref:Uncharacterized protein n=1 Tax=Steinernema hermaphroditum TaxID=289476 RepID=A0AA39H5K6_9BILA|nr:hypothetical protein QR680_003148 [Steinernema hermaphroditum]